MRIYVSAIVILITSLFASNTQAQIVINEYSAANLSTYTDQYIKTEDWLELYNTGVATVQLQGHYLSDDSLVPMKYKIPFSTFISAGGFVRIWLSGRPSYTSNQIHATFKLSQTKTNNQVLCFSDANGVIKDKIKVSKTQLGHSRGRVTNGASTWRIFTTPTINASNNSAANYVKYAEKPSFSLVPGIYTGTQTITIVNNDTSSSVIRYTTTGYEPNSSSPIYTAPITITANTVLKAKCYSNNVNILPSFMEFSTYFMGINHTIPIVSISGSALDSLANGDQSLRPMGAIEYFTAAGVRTSKSYGEFNSHGQDSWANDQRSLDFVARDEMGYSKGLKEKLYVQTTRDDFQRIILRAAGDDNYPAAFHSANEGSAHLRDAYFQNLCKDGGLNLDVRTAAKCIVYLNGEYWGVYDLREKPDDHDYTNYNYNQDKYHLQYLLTWGSTWSEYGGTASTTAWNSLRNYIKVNNMANPIKYQYVLSQLDVTSLADYVISHSLSVSSDWLNYNTGWWRGTDTAGTHRKWGYILWDNDASFAFYINYTGIADTSASADVCNVEQLTNPSSDPEEHITILNRLLQNPSFKQYYVMRYNDLLNTTFSCDYMLNYLDSVKNVIDPEMAAHATRWYGTYNDWLNNYNRLRDFISRRCGTNPAMNMTGCYNLTGPYPVTFTANPDSVATLQVNSLMVNKLPWTANYYGGIDVKLVATPKNPSLYSFSNYTSTSNINFVGGATNDSVSIRAAGQDTITAHFNNIITNVKSIETKALSNVPVTTVYPTVFTGYTNFNFYLPTNSKVQIVLKDMNGKTIQLLNNGLETIAEGDYNLTVDLQKSNLSKGTYLLYFKADNFVKTHKIVYQ